MSLDPSLCAVVLLMSAVSSRGLQTRLRARFIVSDVFLDSSSPSETTCLYIICHSACLSICLSVCLSQDLTRGTSCFISIVVLTHPVLKHLRMWACGCESVSLCASTVRVCHCVPLQWGCVIVSLYSEGVSLWASTVRVWQWVIVWGCDGVLDHVCRCWRALKNITSHFNMKGSSKLPSPFNII